MQKLVLILDEELNTKLEKARAITEQSRAGITRYCLKKVLDEILKREDAGTQRQS